MISSMDVKGHPGRLRAPQYRSRARAPWLAVAAIAGPVGWTVLQQLDAPTSWRAVVAGVGVGVPLLIGELRERRRQDDEWTQLLDTHLSLRTSTGDLPLVGAVDDPVLLGVTPLGAHRRNVCQPTGLPPA
jgi:hypothetical protein